MNRKYQVINTVPLVDNLLAFIEANQSDELAYFDRPDLSGFEKFYSNASGRLQTIFPALMVLTQEIETDLTGDILVGGLQLVLEGAIKGPNTDELVRDAKVYATAVESMLSNIDTASFAADSNISSLALYEIQTKQDVVNRLSSGYLQIFQTRVLYRVNAGAY